MAAELAMRPMGGQGLVTSMQGYGCMGLTAFYGPSLPDDQATAVLEKAYALGVRHFDTAEVYAGKDAEGTPKHNENLVGPFVKAVREREPTSQITFATKYWPNPADADAAACTPAKVREAVDKSMERLGLDCIDLYYLHRIPSEDGLKSWMAAVKDLVAEGKIKYVGLSEATAAEIRLAHEIHPLTAIQQEWSLLVRGLETDIVPTCRELGIAIVAYSPLCRGMTSATVKTDADWSKIGTGDQKFQNMCPHLSGDNLAANAKLLEPLEAEAAVLNVTAAELSLAWVQAQGEDVFPIPGTTKVANLEKNVASTHLSLNVAKETFTKIAVAPDAVQGDRYPAAFHGMSFEKRT